MVLKMASFISWNKEGNIYYVFMFLIISIIIQVFIVQELYLNYPVYSYPVLILVPLGVIFVITGSMVLCSDFIYQYIYIKRQNKLLEMGKTLEKEPSKLPAIFLGMAIITGLYLLIELLFVYIFMDPIWMHGIPTYGQFTLSQTLSGLIIIILFWILKELQTSKRIKK